MAPVKEIEFERVLSAPIETVWQAWTDPKILKQWWGPENVSIPECAVDLRVGGRIYLVMEATAAMGPYKGTRWPMEGEFTVVEENARLSYRAKAWTGGQEDTTEVDQVSELSLTEEGGKTKLKLKVTVNKVGPGAGMAVEGIQAGYTQQFDKLEEFLEKQLLA